jgi:hypothetical protein
LDNTHFNIENVASDNACFYRAIANGIKQNYHNNPNKYYSKDLEEQTNLSQELQQIILKWVSNNPNKLIEFNSEISITVKELIEMIHGISYDDYLERYSYFAGDYCFMGDRWGSFFEQSVLSEIFKITIIVLGLKKYDTNINKIITGRIYLNSHAYKNTRYQVLQISGKQYMENMNYNNGKKPLFLLYRKNKKGSEHYMSIYPKNNVIQHIKDIVN